jgi:hypothetical protein
MFLFDGLRCVKKLSEMVGGWWNRVEAVWVQGIVRLRFWGLAGVSLLDGPGWEKKLPDMVGAWRWNRVKGKKGVYVGEENMP